MEHITFLRKLKDGQFFCRGNILTEGAFVGQLYLILTDCVGYNKLSYLVLYYVIICSLLITVLFNKVLASGSL